MNYTRTTTAAFAAALLLGQALPAQADPIWKDAVIFGKVTLQDAPLDPWDGDVYLSVTIPASDNMPDNVQIWNLGTIQFGSVYDSFYNGGPGYFRVKNTGTYPAYVYVSTGDGDLRGGDGWSNMSDLAFEVCEILNRNGEYCEYQFLQPNPWFHQIRNSDLAFSSYKLAVSTDVTAVVPTWRQLSYIFCYNPNSGSYYADGRDLKYDEYYVYDAQNQQIDADYCQASAYLAYMPVGETQLFDLKFWAPRERWRSEDNYLFFIRIEAAAFKLWNHNQ